MKYVLTAAAYLASLILVAGLAFVAVIVFAGPHSDILPAPLQVLFMIAAWAAVLCLPLLAARKVWKRTPERS